MTQPSSSAKRKPALDEESFQQVLQAAYVLQQHNDQLRVVAGLNGDATRSLAEILEIQRSIENGDIDPPSALRLIVARTRHLTGASGVAIAMLEGREVAYRAAIGTAAQDEGLRLPLDSSLSEQCLRTGQLVQFPNLLRVPPSFSQLCQQYGIEGLITAPIRPHGTLAGVLELRTKRAESFHETDVHIAELMAGLVAEAISREPAREMNEAVAGDKVAMLRAIEAIKPELERLIRDQAVSAEAAGAKSNSASLTSESLTAARDANAVCRCGNRFEGTEKFCGKCGAARFSALRRDIQSNWASLGYLQQLKPAQPPLPIPTGPAEDGTPSHNPTPAPDGVSLEEIVAELSPAESTDANQPTQSVVAKDPQAEATPNVSEPGLEITGAAETLPPAEAEQPVPSDLAAPDTDPHEALDSHSHPGTAMVPIRILPLEITHEASAIEPLPRTSVLKAWAWWKKVKRERSGKWLGYQWNKHRANIWMGVSVVTLLVAIVMNGTSVPQAANGNRHHRHPGAPNLTLFEQLLVSIGLAEAPPPPVYYGNPSAKVWVDVKTALYYCSGAELYGKTDGGKLTTQQDAQQDQFEPANRQACD